MSSFRPPSWPSLPFLARFAEAQRDPAIGEKLKALYMEPLGTSPAEFKILLKRILVTVTTVLSLLFRHPSCRD